MKLEYLQRLPKQELNRYVMSLVNKVYSILPTYEEQGLDEQLTEKVRGLLRNIGGFLCVCEYDTIVCLDIISYLQELEFANTHKDVKACVLKVCNLLSGLRVGD